VWRICIECSGVLILIGGVWGDVEMCVSNHVKGNLFYREACIKREKPGEENNCILMIHAPFFFSFFFSFALRIFHCTCWCWRLRLYYDLAAYF
jgi:hypothetical protein